MKVLLIDVNCKNSSTGKIVYDLYTGINEAGDKAAVCYGRGDKIREENIFKFGLDWETYMHALLTRITGYTGCFSFFSTRRLLKYIEVFKPDVVHIHELHAYFVNLKPLIRYLKKKHIKTVMTLHCEFAYTGKCGHSAECEKWKTECGNCPQLREYVGTLFFDHTRYMYRQKKVLFGDFHDLVITTPSSWLANRAKMSFLKDHNIVVVHNSIDTTLFCKSDVSEIRETHHIAESTRVVLALAPEIMSENKGGRFVLELAKRFNSENVIFILIGDDQEEPYERNNVISLGKIYNKQLLAKYYSLADVFIICSKNENFPTTCIEAACCGTPIAGFDVGGVKETIPNSMGCFCQYGDLEALEKCVRQLFDYSINENEIEKIRAHYNLSRMCEDYLRIYA